MVVRQLIALPSQLQLIDRLQHHIYLSSSLIFLSSQQGAGKSTLLEQLTNQLAANTQQAFIKLNDQHSDAQIRQQVLLQLYENPLFDAQDSFYASLALLQEKHNSDAPRLMVFDNAEHLSPQLLSELAELIAQKMAFGEQEINVLLLADETSSRQMFAQANQHCACLEFKLEPLSSDEAERLLKHLFQQVGYQPRIQHQDAVSKQLSACQGIPGKIIRLAEKIMAGELANGEPSWLKTRLPAILLMLLLVAIAGGLATYLYPLFIKSPSAMHEVKQTEPLAEEVLNRSATPAEIVSEAVMEEQLAGRWQDKPLVDIADNDLQVGIDDPVAPADPQAPVAQPTKIITEQAPSENVDQGEENTALISTADSKLSDNQQQSAIAAEQQANQPEPQAEQPVAVSDPPSLQVAQSVAANDPPSQQVAQSLEVAKQGGRFTDKALLLAIPSTHYTLQLSAMSTQASLRRFIAEHGEITNNLHIYQTEYNNKPRYVVIFGEYDSWAAASRATKALPGSLANLDSWIKKYQLVHRDLQVNND